MGGLLKRDGGTDRPLMLSDVKGLFGGSATGAGMTNAESQRMGLGSTYDLEPAQRLPPPKGAEPVQLSEDMLKRKGIPSRVPVKGGGDVGVSYDQAMEAAGQLPFKITWIEQVGPDKWIPRGSDDETGGGAGSPPEPPQIPDWLRNYMKGLR